MTNPPLESIASLAQLLPLRSIVVSLKITQQITTPFMHHVPLHAWVRNLCASPEGFSDHLAIQPLENGHLTFEPGEHYRFLATATSGGTAILQHLIQKLQQLPQSAKHLPEDAIFHHNVQLGSIHCRFSASPVEHIEDTMLFGPEQLNKQINWWQQQAGATLRSISPLRLSLPHTTDTKPTKQKERFCRDRLDITAELFSHRLQDTFIHLLQKQTGIRHSRIDWPALQLNPQLCFWVEHFYGNQQSRGRASRKPMGGALLQLQLENISKLPELPLALLILGQLTGIGQSRSFGMGQYQLLNDQGIAPFYTPPAAQSLLHQYLKPEEIQNTLEQAVESETLEDERASHYRALTRLSRAIITGDFNPPVLQHVDIAKPDGGTRTLSIPPWQDRVLQKVIARQLSTTLDQLWKDHSYGYRKGRSRYNARDMINLYIRQGYQWALESDVDSFFDSVCWENLEARLALIFPSDPLVKLLMQWVKAPLRTEHGELQPRKAGLPQGAPISPLLANLILDDFDADMLALDYKLVRYADDFVLLFRSEPQAHNAIPKVVASLAEHGLAINPAKTRIVKASQGFRYLGFLFIDGYAIETNVEHRAAQNRLDSPALFSNEDTRTARQEATDHNLIGERKNLGTFLAIAGDLAFLSCENRRLKVTQNENDRYYSWQELQSILLIGPHHITTPTLRKAMAHNIPVHFASGFGQYQGVSCANQPNQGHQLWQLQITQFQRPAYTLEMAKALIQSKISGHISLITSRNNGWPELQRLKRIKSKINRCTDAATLRGYEGEAAKYLWQFMQQHLDSEWQFNGRNRRPPKDPVNTLLSLGYTHLFHLVDTINHVVGLCPWEGFFHQEHGSHRTLASDLMEPLRVVVDRAILGLINRKQLSPDDFAMHEQGCEMSQPARKLLLSAIMAELTRVKPKTGERVLDEILTQAQSVKTAIKLGTCFQPWQP